MARGARLGAGGSFHGRRHLPAAVVGKGGPRDRQGRGRQIEDPATMIGCRLSFKSSAKKSTMANAPRRLCFRVYRAANRLADQEGIFRPRLIGFHHTDLGRAFARRPPAQPNWRPALSKKAILSDRVKRGNSGYTKCPNTLGLTGRAGANSSLNSLPVGPAITPSTWSIGYLDVLDRPHIPNTGEPNDSEFP